MVTYNAVNMGSAHPIMVNYHTVCGTGTVSLQSFNQEPSDAILTPACMVCFGVQNYFLYT